MVMTGHAATKIQTGESACQQKEQRPAAFGAGLCDCCCCRLFGGPAFDKELRDRAYEGA